ncbi:hypothetical protein L9F63_023985, partial [Diploptera punctata]
KPKKPNTSNLQYITPQQTRHDTNDNPSKTEQTERESPRRPAIRFHYGAPKLRPAGRIPPSIIFYPAPSMSNGTKICEMKCLAVKH